LFLLVAIVEDIFCPIHLPFVPIPDRLHSHRSVLDHLCFSAVYYREIVENDVKLCADRISLALD